MEQTLFHPFFLQVSQIFQRRKSDANKQDFENKLDLTSQTQSTLKTTGILTKVFSTSGPNLVALAWTGDDVITQTSSKCGKFWLWSSIWPWRSRSITPKNNRDLNQGLYTNGSNLVILAWTGDELSRRQASDYRTHGRTDTQTQATTIPEGENWPRVKSEWLPTPNPPHEQQITWTLTNQVSTSIETEDQEPKQSSNNSGLNQRGRDPEQEKIRKSQ